jgi:hypothetical protein
MRSSTKSNGQSGRAVTLASSGDHDSRRGLWRPRLTLSIDRQMSASPLPMLNQYSQQIQLDLAWRPGAIRTEETREQGSPPSLTESPGLSTVGSCAAEGEEKFCSANDLRSMDPSAFALAAYASALNWHSAIRVATHTRASSRWQRSVFEMPRCARLAPWPVFEKGNVFREWFVGVEVFLVC